jgi:hypothetical protein
MAGPTSLNLFKVMKCQFKDLIAGCQLRTPDGISYVPNNRQGCPHLTISQPL